MFYSKINKFDVNNGPGIRVSLFVSGCRIHCPDCFNKCTWDFSFGREFDSNTLTQLLTFLSEPYISGLTILGGEPFEYENQAGLVSILKTVHNTFPNKNIWCYTGYLFDQDIMYSGIRQHFEMTDEMLSYIDIIVDGPYIKEQKMPSFDYRGSYNQRFIDVKRSLEISDIVYADVSCNRN